MAHRQTLTTRIARAFVQAADFVSGAVQAGLWEVLICVGVFIHWLAEDDAKIQQYNYQATKESIERAVRGEPKVSDVVSKRATARHPFAAQQTEAQAATATTA